jgi:DNA processing protein
MLPGVGGITAKRLVAHCGSAEAVFTSSVRDLSKIPEVNHNFIPLREDALKRAEHELKFMEQNGIRQLFYTDEDFPFALNQCEDAPAAIFVKGDVSFNNTNIISIVGTRSATSYGTALCEKLIAELVEKGHQPLIVSGMAYGIDVCAHRAALNCGLKTVAVMGTGLNKVYPSVHYAIAKQIETQGALLSELPSDTSIVPGNFLSRNRIIAGLSQITVIIESAAKGGALVTAGIANSYNREVAAFPGRVGDKHSEGCNSLIKQNIAAMIESADDLIYLAGWSISKKKSEVQLQLFDKLDKPEQEILELLKAKDSESIDVIAYETGFPMPELSAILLNLEFAGYINALPGKNYSLKKI